MEFFGTVFLPLIKFKTLFGALQLIILPCDQFLSFTAAGTGEARILQSSILPVMLTLCSGIPIQHHIQYPKKKFPSKTLVVGSCPVPPHNQKLNDAQQDMTAINH